MRAYSGNGYNEEFKTTMEDIIVNINAYNKFLKVDDLKNDTKKVELVFSIDSICEKCPNKLGDNICLSQEKVNSIDIKVINYFNLKEDVYNYKDLENLVHNNINEEIFDDICKECEWYGVTNCKDYMKL